MSNNRLYELDFEKSKLEAEIKKAQAEAIRELTKDYTEKFVEMQKDGQVERFSVQVYLNDFVSQIRNIENR